MNCIYISKFVLVSLLVFSSINVFANEQGKAEQKKFCNDCYGVEIEGFGMLQIPDGYWVYIEPMNPQVYKFRRRSEEFGLDSFLSIGVQNVEDNVEYIRSSGPLLAEEEAGISYEVSDSGTIGAIDYLKSSVFYSKINMKIYSCLFYSEEFYLSVDSYEDNTCNELMSSFQEIEN